ncbi:replicative DNA helicase [Buchnera aphidicola]|uniref:Replicative DNA helicase n=1 Tax=Buchnera aphidicola (Therioaphis trifolii) TaxID=1241884 RepID=A0A4D6YN34_9GAMM|nr:replicative DNA helicase [Buchnera aphidicola]QCI27354.1 replicative DNA helicase [Buchnera aphidicola (Therioaphis trifolii)]
MKKYNPLQNSKKKIPYSLEAEQSILGALMLDNKKWDIISNYIISDDFFNISHKLIFNEMKELINHNFPIDLITLSESLEKKKILSKIGKFSYLSEIIKNTPSTENITAYAKIVKECSTLREIISIGKKISYLGYNTHGKNSKEILNDIEYNILKIINKKNKKEKNPKNIRLMLDKTITVIEKLLKYPNNNLTGLDTGYSDLNKKTLGLQKSDLIIIAARPSMGKTTLAMNICENIAITNNKPILIFSLEMPGEQIIIRMLSSLSRVYQSNIRTGNLNDEDWSRISSTINILLKKNNIYIDDSSQLTPTEIRSKSKKLYKKKGLSLIIIDYLQLINVPNLSNQRNLEIAEISKSLKSLAKELKIPIIAVSQLNRSLEQRSDRRPINSDLRESGSLEQDADLIIFIYRDELYNENTELKGIAEIIIGKQRNGPNGTIKLIFNGNLCRFDNYYE